MMKKKINCEYKGKIIIGEEVDSILA